MIDNDRKSNEYNPEEFWRNRYREIDITKSGHIDLPATYNEWLYRRKKDCLLKALNKAAFDPTKSSVLEIATGTGVYVSLWSHLGIERMSGIDISQAATDAVKQRFPSYSFTKYDVSEPGLAETVGKDYDLVTAIDVLYHVVDDDKFNAALKNLAQTTRPGGLLVIHERFLKNSERTFGYIRWRTLSSYVAALERAGFEVLLRLPSFFYSVRPYDLKSPQNEARLNGVWNQIIFPGIQRFPGLFGRIGYWTDTILGSMLKEGPSFEMMVCRRR